MVHDAAVKLTGVKNAAIDIVITCFLRGFGAPALDSMSGRGGIACWNRVGAASIKVHTNDSHKGSGGRVGHSGIGPG